jgi:hypothetical protein
MRREDVAARLTEMEAGQNVMNLSKRGYCVFHMMDHGLITKSIAKNHLDLMMKMNDG